MKRFDSVCVLGGAGLVGYQVCRRLLREGLTDRLAVVSLWREETQRAVVALREEFPHARVQGRYGNIFARGDLADAETEAKDPVFDREDRSRRCELL
ncbi:MAG: NAD-dependent epimerase/dehydratase family protein, partial [Planctomycetota bacterium]|nr:NAD-dependent epimerase/dehydratase family protein [Planctomycetota bacterium]